MARAPQRATRRGQAHAGDRVHPAAGGALQVWRHAPWYTCRAGAPSGPCGAGHRLCPSTTGRDRAGYVRVVQRVTRGTGRAGRPVPGIR